jgi:hypothetical protein
MCCRRSTIMGSSTASMATLISPPSFTPGTYRIYADVRDFEKHVQGSVHSSQYSSTSVVVSTAKAMNSVCVIAGVTCCPRHWALKQRQRSRVPADAIAQTAYDGCGFVDALSPALPSPPSSSCPALIASVSVHIAKEHTCAYICTLQFS